MPAITPEETSTVRMGDADLGGECGNVYATSRLALATVSVDRSVWGTSTVSRFAGGVEGDTVWYVGDSLGFAGMGFLMGFKPRAVDVGSGEEDVDGWGLVELSAVVPVGARVIGA